MPVQSKWPLRPAGLDLMIYFPTLLKYPYSLRCHVRITLYMHVCIVYLFQLSSNSQLSLVQLNRLENKSFSSACLEKVKLT